MSLLTKIKDLQAELMASTELPHQVTVRLLARLDEAERHIPLSVKAPEAVPVIVEGHTDTFGSLPEFVEGQIRESSPLIDAEQ
ncbi:MAG: hypothetical protein Q8K92_19825 [Leadbetterella sp.]|nr:hypothetical protein [Leadbetterella sp.]